MSQSKPLFIHKYLNNLTPACLGHKKTRGHNFNSNEANKLRHCLKTTVHHNWKAKTGNMLSSFNSSAKRPLLAAGNAKNEQYGGRINQIFFITCVASFLLQLLASVASWNSARSLQSSSMIVGFAENQVTELIRQRKGKVASAAPLATPLIALNDQPKHGGRLRILFGILTADFPNDETYRKRHRKLFELWNDPRVCSLPDFKARPANERYECQLIYTFVMAGNPDAPPILVNNERPYEVNKPLTGARSRDVNDPDTILLNIRENMNEGKSQTWMKYGAEIAEEHDLDYVTKCDADSLLHLHDFFEWAYKNLPPAPYNTNVYAGALRDKAYWPRHETEKERIQYESYFGQNFEGVHLYVAGQFYILSTDLARFVGKEAYVNNCSYCEGHEDHDISAMAFHSPEPIKLMVIGRNHRFWEHPVKGVPRWRRMWDRESARVAGVPFEGKKFNSNSTFENVMGYPATQL